MLVAKGNDKLLVGLLLASLVEHTHVSLATVEGLGGLAQTAGKTVVGEGDLQDALESVQNGHLALGGGIGGNLNLLGDFRGVLFYVRLVVGVLVSFLVSIIDRGLRCTQASKL